MNKPAKEKLHIVLTVLFLAVCLIPSVGMLLFDPSDANANEIRSPFPSVRSSDGGFNAEFFSGLSDWFDDRFQLRPELSTAWAKLNATLFRTSVEDSVLLGTDGWLYYADSLDDYTGTLLPEETISAAAENLRKLQQRCDELGIRFVFTVAPNKNSLYPEHMERKYAKGEATNAELLYEKLDSLNVNYVNLHDVFRSQPEILYFREDSHWNARGAALAADALLKALCINRTAGVASENTGGFSTPEKENSSFSFFDGPFGEGEIHTGDLFEMLYPSAVSGERDCEYLPGFTFRALSSPRGGEAINFSTESATADTGAAPDTDPVNPTSAPDPAGNAGAASADAAPSADTDNASPYGRLLCWRDSFGNSLYPYLAEAFSYADFSRENPYDLTRITTGNYDAVIVEIVERNIAWLANQ